MSSKVRFYPEPVLRTLVAFLSAYAFTRWSSLAVLALPLPPEQAVMLGTLAGFAVFAATVIGVFLAKNLYTACWGLLPLGLLLLYFSQETSG
ncbi:hypothetical protein V6U78_03165 [Marinospirillum sp. MEB164]|uniref:Iron uptake protein n=1 Tax=Marinospirillum alkalitolerans TaxID=3123374 RepID=A0ABW8PUS7_9GAMM